MSGPGRSLLDDSPIAIAGAGRIAQAFGRLLSERGEPVVAVASRDIDHAASAAAFIGSGVRAMTYSRLPALATRILIAVADDAVASVAGLLAECGLNRGVALHTSGVHGPEALAALQERGVACGTLHPLQTVAGPEQGVAALPGAAFAICGDEAAAGWAEHIAALLDGVVLRIPADRRAAYHAAAVMAGNYVIGLIDAAVMLMGAAGISEEQALQALGPLVRTSAGNALAAGPLDALTGPIERGDAETVWAHLGALEQCPESVRQLYRSAGLHVLNLARRRGLAETAARKVEELLQGREKRYG